MTQLANRHDTDPSSDAHQSAIQTVESTPWYKTGLGRLGIGALTGAILTTTGVLVGYGLNQRAGASPEGDQPSAGAPSTPGGEKSPAKSETELRVEKAIAESGMKPIIFDETDQGKWKTGDIDYKSRTTDRLVGPELAKFIAYLNKHQDITPEELNALASMLFLHGANDSTVKQLVEQSQQRYKDGALDQETIVTVCGSYTNELSGRCTGAERSGIETIEFKNPVTKISYTVNRANSSPTSAPKGSRYITKAENSLINVYAGQLLIGS